MLHYRPLGRTGLMVSEIGLGGAGLGRDEGPDADQAVADAVDFALAEGINLIDVAPLDGDGRAERAVGAVLQGRRERVVLASAVMLRPDERTTIPDAIERSLHESLARLDTDHLDLLQLQNPLVTEPGLSSFGLTRQDVLDPQGAAATLQRLKDTGMVRCIGLNGVDFSGVGDAGAVRDVLQDGGFDTVRIPYHLLNTTAAKPRPRNATIQDMGQILPLAAKLGLGVIGIHGLAGGALSEAPDWPVVPGTLLARDLARAESLGFLQRPSRPLSQIAIRFALEPIPVSSVIVEVKNRTEVAAALAAGALAPLSRTERARLARLQAQDFGVAEPPPVV